MIAIPASLRSDFIHITGTPIHIALESTIHITGIRSLSCFSAYIYLKTPRKRPIFGDELVTSFSFLRRKDAAHIGLAGQWAYLLSMSGLWTNSRKLTSGKIEQIHSSWIKFEVAGEDHNLMDGRMGDGLLGWKNH